MAASATFALKAGVWFRRARRCMVSPDSQATACPLSGRNSTYRPVQISGTSSNYAARLHIKLAVNEEANIEAALFYDFSGYKCFIACYVPSEKLGLVYYLQL